MGGGGAPGPALPLRDALPDAPGQRLVRGFKSAPADRRGPVTLRSAKLERDLSGARGYRGRLSPLIDGGGEDLVQRHTVHFAVMSNTLNVRYIRETGVPQIGAPVIRK